MYAPFPPFAWRIMFATVVFMPVIVIGGVELGEAMVTVGGFATGPRSVSGLVIVTDSLYVPAGTSTIACGGGRRADAFAVEAHLGWIAVAPRNAGHRSRRSARAGGVDRHQQRLCDHARQHSNTSSALHDRPHARASSSQRTCHRTLIE